ncbi:hypothetical protein l11_16920 [Neisseria weaveri LMG 5135]|nr:hypothetical protein l11_16920 [Neisseria weaveri LMG 5135]
MHCLLKINVNIVIEKLVESVFGANNTRNTNRFFMFISIF